MTRIPAITIWQPWATLIVDGHKPYEFRGWSAPRALWGRRIAIHAGARPIRRKEMQDLLLRMREKSAKRAAIDEAAIPTIEAALASPGAFPRGVVLATATLGVPIPPAKVKEMFGNDSDRLEHFQWAWPMLDIKRLAEPVQATGSQGFWHWECPADAG